VHKADADPAARRDWRRVTGLSGLGFVVCFAIAAVLYGGGAGSQQQEISAYYANAGSRIHQIEGFAVLIAGCVILMIYVAVLQRLVAEGSWMRQLAGMSGTVAVVFLMLANALWASTAFTVEIQRGYAVDAASHLLLEDAAFVCLITSMVAAIPWVLVTSISGVRSGAMPRWFALLGIIATVGQVFAYWYVPLLGFFLWVAAGSILLVRRSVSGTGGLR
jgi:hypothetical protein